MTLLSDLYTGGGNVTAAANIADNAVVAGNGGVKGVQDRAMLISDNGEMTNPSQPAFMCYVTDTVSDVTGNGTVYSLAAAIWTEVFDQGNDISNGLFTAPITGRYLFSGILDLRGANLGSTSMQRRLITSNKTYEITYNNPTNVNSGGTSIASFGIIVDMDATDTAYLDVTCTGSGADDADVGAQTVFSGALIC